MTILSQHSLRAQNTFKFPANAKTYYQLNNVEDLALLPESLTRSGFYILGDGSNTLFIEKEIDCIVHPQIKGVEILERSDDFQVTAYAGENWHQLVVSLIEKGIFGLENLALIPGSVGAAPVQNIGAYGVELSDYCQQVVWYDLKERALKTLSKEECQFGYRDSIFKGDLKDKGIIVSIQLSFPKEWSPKLTYNGLDGLAENVTAKGVMEQVISLRESKLPDPKVIANAGSFFKNPVLNNEKFEELLALNPNVPNYPQADGTVKVAAGWLIEQAGLKGIEIDGVGVHKKQALVLVNYDSDDSQTLIILARKVVATVLEKFSIKLEPEVRFVGTHGEVNSIEVVSCD